MSDDDLLGTPSWLDMPPEPTAARQPKEALPPKTTARTVPNSRPAGADTRIRPYLAVAGAFVALLLLGELATRVWVQQTDQQQILWYDASAQLRADYLDQAEVDPDVLFAGTSMAWQGFVPSVFAAEDPAGRSSYNVGLPGGVPQVTERWLTDYVLEAADPELVVWGLASLDFSSSYGATNFESWTSAREPGTGWLDGVDAWASERSALLQWRRVLRDPAAWSGDERATDLSEAAETLGPDGERLDFTVDLGAERAAVQRSRLSDAGPDAQDVAAVIRGIEAARRSGAEVVLVQMPMPGRFVDLHPAGAADVARVRQLVTLIGTEMNVPVIDLSDGFDDSQFVDFTHLDAAGAATLTQRLASELAALGR